MVEKATRVVVYGSSLHMAGIVTSLREEAGLELVLLKPGSHGIRQRLKELQPAVILFDLSDPASNLDVALLREGPGLVLIGADPSSDELLVLSSQPAQALTMSDLIAVIHTRTSNEEDIYLKE